MTLAADHPATRHMIALDPLPDRSAHGLPLANGRLGGLIWADGEAVLISLDRADLWDLRDVPEFQGPSYTNDALADMVEAGEMARVEEAFEAPYRRPAPTKLPAGRIRILTSAGDAKPSGMLHLDRAVATVRTGQATLNAAVHAEQEIGLLWGLGDLPGLTLHPPAFGQPVSPDRAPNPLSPFGAEDLDYPLPTLVSETGLSGYVQDLPDGRAFCALLGWQTGDLWHAVWTIQIASSAAAAEAAARDCLRLALATDIRQAVSAHEAWWATWWSRAWLAVPDPVLERQWTLDAYKLGAAARMGAPPVALQAQWTGDDGRLPPWKGDYHHDLNTQMTYWPCLTGNHLDAHLGFLEWLWDTRDACGDWTRRFFQVEGLNVPMTADLANRQLGGWAPYTHSATTGAWLAHHFAEHWRMSGDEAFLRDRAWPYVSECAKFLDALIRRDSVDGQRRLRLSSSPEIGDNRREAWFIGWSNYDLMLTRTLFGHAARMAEALNEAETATHWSGLLALLPHPALDDAGAFAVAPGIPFAQSHRHFSHLMAIHPLAQVEPDDDRVAATIASLDRAGTEMWMGYTFAWSAGLLAMAGEGERAAERLHQFAAGFTAPNSFHTNGEVGTQGLTRFNFEAFTLEGNCAAMAATQDMLLQSRGSLIDVFPAIPKAWNTGRFTGLLAEGGVLVDAELTPDTARITLRASRPYDRTIRAFRSQDQHVTLGPGEPHHIVLPRARLLA